MIELTQQDWDALYQPHKELYIRLDLYQLLTETNISFPLKKVDEISTVVVDGSVQEDAESDTRRTANLTLHVLDSTMTLSEDSKVWLDKLIRPYLGYKAPKTDDILWYDLGIMEMTGARYEYSPSTRTLTLSLADMTVSLDGTKGGDVLGADPTFEIDPTKFSEEQLSIRRAVETVLSNLGGIHMFYIDNIGPYGKEDDTTQNRIPYTQQWTRPVTVYQMIKDLRDLYPGYESYFEKDGTFRLKRIPDCTNAPVVIEYEQLEPLVVSESSNGLDFQGIYNVVEVVGQSYEFESTGSTTSPSERATSTGSGAKNISFFTHIVTGSGGDYQGLFESFEGRDAFQDYDRFTFIPNCDNTNTSCSLKVNDMPALDIYMEIPEQGVKQIPPGFIKTGIPIVVEYMPDMNGRRGFKYLGRTQIVGVCILTNKQPKWAERKNDILRYNTQNISYRVIEDSPLTIERIKPRQKSFSGSEYANISTEVAALERAQYELWKSTNLNYSMTLTTVIIPWLEVNQKIEYRSPLDELQRQELGLPADTENIPQYIIKRIDRSLTEGTQTMEIVRFYNKFPIIGSV